MTELLQHGAVDREFKPGVSVARHGVLLYVYVCLGCLDFVWNSAISFAVLVTLLIVWLRCWFNFVWNCYASVRYNEKRHRLCSTYLIFVTNITNIFVEKQARKPRSYASSKL